MCTPIVPRGFTMTELLVVIAIIGIVTAMTVVGFQSLVSGAGVRAATAEIADALRDARTSAQSGLGDTTYGVRVASSSVTRFGGSSYVSGQAGNLVYPFEGGAYATGTLVSAGTSIVFARLTGVPSVTGSILVTDIDTGRTATITIGATGLVEY